MPVWFTSLTPDLRHAEVRRDFDNAVGLHRRVMSLVPDHLGAEARRVAGVLYRVESHKAGQRLLVQSLVDPDLSQLPDGYQAVMVGKLDRLLDRLRTGSLMRYRIAANTVLTRPRGWTGPGKPGQRVAVRGAAAEQWWHTRAPRIGLELRSAVATPLPDIRGERAGAPMRHAVTQFDGVAVIGDPDLVRQAVTTGVGKGKSYGCGLLSLLPTSDAR